jgi:hypothetical protein
MIHHRIENTIDITGLSLTAGRKGEKVKVAVKGFITSNEKLFFTGIRDIYSIFLQQFIQLEECNQFLILRHKDKSADIYINDFKRLLRCISKCKLIPRQLVKKTDIADIVALEFPNIKISKTDAIIFCMRVGWKFGLYFNFTANPNLTRGIELDLSQINYELGYAYRFLLFEEEHELIKNEELYPKMLSDGWFPFIELIGADYKELSNLYSYQWLDQIDGFLKKFDKGRINKMTKSWWSKKQFQDKRKLIEAGISAFLQDRNSGYINCINTLYPQIEGIMGFEFYKAHGKKPSFKKLKEYIRNRAQNKFFSKGSLGFPEYFYEFLDKDVFQNFDLSTGKIDLARHSLTHGYAKQEDFTKVKALQALLILNQIFFYL